MFERDRIASDIKWSHSPILVRQSAGDTPIRAGVPSSATQPSARGMPRPGPVAVPPKSVEFDGVALDLRRRARTLEAGVSAPSLVSVCRLDRNFDVETREVSARCVLECRWVVEVKGNRDATSASQEEVRQRDLYGND